MLPLLELNLGSGAYLDYTYPTDQLRLPLLKLLPVKIGGGLLYLGLNLLDSGLDCLLRALALNNSVLSLSDGYPARPAQVFHSNRVQLAPHLLRDYLAAGKDSNILQHCLAPVAKAGGFNRQNI